MSLAICIGFNGAAPARARNEAQICDGRVALTELQRGRARAGAECMPAASPV